MRLGELDLEDENGNYFYTIFHEFTITQRRYAIMIHKMVEVWIGKYLLKEKLGDKRVFIYTLYLGSRYFILYMSTSGLLVCRYLFPFPVCHALAHVELANFSHSLSAVFKDNFVFSGNGSASMVTIRTRRVYIIHVLVCAYIRLLIRPLLLCDLALFICDQLLPPT